MTHDAGLGRLLVRHDERNGWRLLLGALVAGGSRLDPSLWGRRSQDAGRAIAAACRRHGCKVVEREVTMS